MESSPEAFVDFLNLSSESLAGVVPFATWSGAWGSPGLHLGVDLTLRLSKSIVWEARGLGASFGTAMPLHLLSDSEATLDLELDDLRVARGAGPGLPRLHISVSLCVSHRGLGLIQVIEGVRTRRVLHERLRGESHLLAFEETGFTVGEARFPEL